jgi:hypothetical protein
MTAGKIETSGHDDDGMNEQPSGGAPSIMEIALGATPVR